MRTVIVAAIALLMGLVLGSLGPRDELRDAQARITELEAKLAAKPKRQALTRGLLNMGTSRRSIAERDEEPEVKLADDPPRAESEDAPAPSSEEAAADDEAQDDDRRGPSPEKLDEIRTAIDLRRTQARAALMERAQLNEQQQATFDEAVAHMNEGLEAVAADFADMMAEGREPTRREAMHMADDVLGLLLDADETFAGSMTEEQYAAAGEEAVDPLSFIDPSLVDFLQEL